MRTSSFKKSVQRFLTLICLLGLLATSGICTVAQSSGHMDLLDDCERIVFLGDSITWAGDYVAEFDAWLLKKKLEPGSIIINVGLPSETVSGQSENGHAGGRFPRPDLAERLARVLETTRPDLVIACYGINCGIYQPFDESRFNSFQTGIQNLVDQVAMADAKLVLMTPPTFDDAQSQKKFSYDGVMRRYSDWLVFMKEDGWNVIDLHTAMAEELERQRRVDPTFTFQRDAVHPDRRGHRLIAGTLIEWFDPVDADRKDHPHSIEIKKRLDVLRDAYLSAAEHKRPGIKKGLSIQEAELKAAEYTRLINRE